MYVFFQNIFKVILNSDLPMTAVLARFQEFTEYRDVQQYGLRVLASIAYKK